MTDTPPGPRKTPVWLTVLLVILAVLIIGGGVCVALLSGIR